MRAVLSEKQELLDRAFALGGCTIEEVAATVGRVVPADQSRAKGFVGLLLEAVLRATAGNRAEPDFPELGIELKTLPVRADGRPTESTFVCRIPLAEIAETEWPASRVRKKLGCVLFVPIEADKEIPLRERRVGRAFLWMPDEAEEQQLRDDWSELAGILATGGADAITAHLGTALQVRPKAASSRVRQRNLIDSGASGGELGTNNPKGFYLRRSFTEGILRASLRRAS